MKKIECVIGAEKNAIIDGICEKESYTRAEFNRRAIDVFLNQHGVFSVENATYFFQCPDCKADISLSSGNGLPPKVNFIKHKS